MKAIVIAALLALSFTTGFTCSKNEPATDETVVEETTETMTEEAAPPAEEAPAADEAAQ